MHSLDNASTHNELKIALVRKAGGGIGILPALILCGCPELHHTLLLLLMKHIQMAWVVVKYWKDMENVHIQKTDLRNCNNWRGISFLDGCNWQVAWEDVAG